MTVLLVSGVWAQEAAPNLSAKNEVISAAPQKAQAISAPKALTVEDLTGEVISYSIKQGPLSVGSAKLAFKGRVQGKSGEAILIHVKWGIPGFNSDENIFLDPDTLALRFVEKDRNKLGCKIQILEDYFPEEGKVVIDRDTCGKKTQEVIDHPGPVHSVYGMIYQTRLREGDMDSFKPFAVHMLDRIENFAFKGVKKVKADGDSYDARRFESETFGLWLSPGRERIPLRIESSEEIHVTMVMKKRSFGEDEDDEAQAGEAAAEDVDGHSAGDSKE